VPAVVGIEERANVRGGHGATNARCDARPSRFIPNPLSSSIRPRGEVTHMTRLATRIAAALSGIIAIVLAGGAHWKS
jgi:hypothetical protein